jgi:hypothetical protein
VLCYILFSFCIADGFETKVEKCITRVHSFINSVVGVACMSPLC